jgi:hypothetical protein
MPPSTQVKYAASSHSPNTNIIKQHSESEMLKLRKRRFYLAVFPHHFVRFTASQELIHFNGLGGSHLAWLCLAPAAAGFSPWDEARTLSLTPNFTYRAALSMGVAGRMPSAVLLQGGRFRF